ncbi:conserved hypothetical protein (plasmid) [Borreliella burgdorferi WI91-23]|nr:conserved hypothetical protein [Borreliella burgdorferi WI91-23]
MCKTIVSFGWGESFSLLKIVSVNLEIVHWFLICRNFNKLE